MQSASQASQLSERTDALHLESGSQFRPWLAISVGLGVLVVSTAGLLTGVGLFANWYYLWAWYAVLLAGDGWIALRSAAGRGRDGEFLLLGRKWYLVSVLGWSSVAWFFYELLNFRLQNWYYINLPHDLMLRWVATAIAFATVFPAVFVSEALLDSFGLYHTTRWKKLPVTPRFLTGMLIAGAIMMALVLVWPRYFFPLVWGASMLMVEPTVYRRNREHSLLADLERGEPGRLLRLLTGGAIIGLVWEALNIKARTKWIYTVPGLEEVKLFEMPVLGFFGFPPFAVECFILWSALVSAGLAVPRLGIVRHASSRRRGVAAAVAFVFCIIVLIGMELFTFTSRRPELQQLPDVDATTLGAAGFDAFRLAATQPTEVARLVGITPEHAREWVESARIATLRGIGTDNMLLLRDLGIHTIDQLAGADSHKLIADIEQLTGEEWVDARIRVWIRGARSAAQ